MKKIINQILKFGLVGGIAFIIDYVFLYLFTEYFNIYYLQLKLENLEQAQF